MKFFPKSLNVNVDSADISKKIPAPCQVQKLFSGQSHVLVDDQSMQQLKFLAGELHRSAVGSDLAGGKVDFRGANPDKGLFFLKTPQNDMNSGDQFFHGEWF